MTPLSISFLVATYRMAPYVAIMLDSIAACMRSGDQLVIVDDGSKDETAATCRRWLQTRCPEGLLIEQANSGVCASRNTALRHATGEYVLILDGDDELIPEGFDRLREVLAAHKPDVVAFDFLHWQPGAQPEFRASKPKSHAPDVLISDRSAILRATLEDRAWAPWRRLLRRTLVTEPNRQPLFPEQSAIDDAPVIPIVVSRAQNLFYLTEALVRYRQTPNSLSTQRSARLCLDIGASPAHALPRMAPLPATHEVQRAVHLWVGRMFYEGVRMSLHSPQTQASLFFQLYQRAIAQPYPDPAPLIRSLLSTEVPLDRKIAREIQRFARYPRLQSRLRALSARLKQR